MTNLIEPTAFDASGSLFHYTSAEKAVVYIIPEQRLKLGSMANANDPWEFAGAKPIFQSPDKGQFESPDVSNRLMEEFRKVCRTGCFTFGKSRMISTSMPQFATGNEGCFNLPMWWHYAEKLHGVCLEFDRNRLENEFLRIPARRKFNGLITYLCVPDGFAISLDPGTNPAGTLRDKSVWAERIFERMVTAKHEFWSYENEYRMAVLADEDVSLNVKSSLKAVYVAEKFTGDREALKRSLAAYDLKPKLYEVDFRYRHFQRREV